MKSSDKSIISIILISFLFAFKIVDTESFAITLKPSLKVGRSKYAVHDPQYNGTRSQRLLFLGQIGVYLANKWILAFPSQYIN